MFPPAPNVAGLPLWLQVPILVAFVFATASVAFVGYRRRQEREPGGAAATVLAAFPDMAAVRQLTDQCRVLGEHIERLDASLRDQTHYLRNKIEVEQELCMRLRELKEEIVRSDKQLARREVSPRPGS